MSGAGQRKSPLKMWGGRFQDEPDPMFYEFQRSWQFDQRLLPYELALDRAWARALQEAAVLTTKEYSDMLKALDDIGAGPPDPSLAGKAEDVHHFIELALTERLGAVAAKLHTGRSRNEMVATEFRMFVRDAAREMRAAIATLAGALADQAAQHLDVAMPGTTHTQHAQPILLAHWLLAHGEGLLRDVQRISAAAEQAGACPLGSGALAGCPYPVNRWRLAQELGFSRLTANSLDAVSDREFALEYLFALTLLAVHLSRLAEDVILFATPEFGFVTLPDAYSTGSSLMPQKKNPDLWELLRGKTGRITGALLGLVMVLKGLPSSFHRDLQEDKEALFGAHDQALAMTQLAARALAATRFNADRLRAAAASDSAILATEVADYLVRRGTPFRHAHEIAGRAVRMAEEQATSIFELPDAALQQLSPIFDHGFRSISVESAIAAREVPGGTARSSVAAALAKFRERLAAIPAT